MHCIAVSQEIRYFSQDARSSIGLSVCAKGMCWVRVGCEDCERFLQGGGENRLCIERSLDWE
jgi:hypothetical protein